MISYLKKAVQLKLFLIGCLYIFTSEASAQQTAQAVTYAYTAWVFLLLLIVPMKILLVSWFTRQPAWRWFFVVVVSSLAALYIVFPLNIRGLAPFDASRWLALLLLSGAVVLIASLICDIILFIVLPAWTRIYEALLGAFVANIISFAAIVGLSLALWSFYPDTYRDLVDIVQSGIPIVPVSWLEKYSLLRFF